MLLSHRRGKGVVGAVYRRGTDAENRPRRDARVCIQRPAATEVKINRPRTGIACKSIATTTCELKCTARELDLGRI